MKLNYPWEVRKESIIFLMCNEKKSVREISDAIDLSPDTVRAYIQRIMTESKVHDRREICLGRKQSSLGDVLS